MVFPCAKNQTTKLACNAADVCDQQWKHNMQGISIYLLSALVSVSETAVDRVNKQGNYVESTLHAVYGLLCGQLWGEKQGKSTNLPVLHILITTFIDICVETAYTQYCTRVGIWVARLGAGINKVSLATRLFQ